MMTARSLKERIKWLLGARVQAPGLAVVGLLAAPFAAGTVAIAADIGTIGMSANNCTALTRFHVPGVSMSIEKATVVPAGIPAPIPFAPPFHTTVPVYCRADGALDSRTGRDGKPYSIRFAIALPEKWNGRFLFQGGGGLNGNVPPPLGYQAVGDTPALARGFAVVATDTGHQSATPFDTAFLSDQEATINFLYQANGKVAPVAKQIVAHFYGRLPDRSYFVGCSTGGREAMMMSQRFPTYFDGIVAGAPAMRTGYSNLGDKWVLTAIDTIAPKDSAGHPVGSQAFSEADRKLIVDSVLKQCDANDGLPDGMIQDPVGCHFDPAVLTCSATKHDGCLSADKVAALAKGFGGPRDSLGRQLYPGFFFDTGIGVGSGFIQGLLAGAPGPLEAAPPLSMDVDREAAVVAANPLNVGDTDSWTNLTTFAGHGGKLIFFHGVSDPWFSAKDTIRYYEQLAADNGGQQQTAQWSRLFLVPGMGHCGGGPATLDQFDMLDAVVGWVEKGAAPEAIKTVGSAFPGRSRPLCSYPRHAHYKGSGDPQNADNFECRS
jgi:hypothetical protein